ncbi:MAG: DUF4251 domain-containing protein [Chitinophagaceae bacterium]
MKKYSLLFFALALILLVVIVPQQSIAQSKKDSAKIAQIASLVDAQHYAFKAQSVTPMSGRLRQLTSDYDVQVAKDVIVSQLPYFGRAYSAPISSTDGGIQFTSKDFEYTTTPKKKGGWDVNIKFKDAGDAKQMQFTIFNNGSATLQVIGNNRQPISFNGYITSPARKK